MIYGYACTASVPSVTTYGTTTIVKLFLAAGLLTI